MRNTLINRRAFLKTMGIAALALSVSRTARFLAAPAPFDVYLTFDDGPTTERDLSGPTVEVLDLLRAEGVPATFFLHGIAINDWEGPILVRMLQEGHAVGNHLWRQGGNTVADGSPWALLAQQYIAAESRLRDILGATDPLVLGAYLAGPHLYRRPGGNNGLTPFLDPKNFAVLEHAPYLRPYRDRLKWLKGVYDYSGWHVTNGDGIPAIKAHPVNADEALWWAVEGGYGYSGVKDFLCTGEPPRRAAEVRDGLIVLMHDAAEIGRAALPRFIAQIRALGGIFRALPRPIDRPNAPTVGIGYAPTPDPHGAACG